MVEEKWNRVLKMADILIDGNTNTFDAISMLQSVELLVLLKVIDKEKDKERKKKAIEELKVYLDEKNDQLYKAVVEHFNK